MWVTFAVAVLDDLETQHIFTHVSKPFFNQAVTCVVRVASMAANFPRPEDKEVFLGNIPCHYGEADILRHFEECSLPLPLKTVLRLGHAGAQLGFAFFSSARDAATVIAQSELCKDLITWDFGTYALIRKAKPKIAAELQATLAATPKVGRIVVTRAMQHQTVVIVPPAIRPRAQMLPGPAQLPIPPPPSTPPPDSASGTAPAQLPIRPRAQMSPDPTTFPPTPPWRRSQVVPPWHIDREVQQVDREVQQVVAPWHTDREVEVDAPWHTDSEVEQASTDNEVKETLTAKRMPRPKVMHHVTGT